MVTNRGLKNLIKQQGLITPQTEWEKTLVSKILKVSNMINERSRRGSGNYFIVNSSNQFFNEN